MERDNFERDVKTICCIVSISHNLHKRSIKIILFECVIISGKRSKQRTRSCSAFFTLCPLPRYLVRASADESVQYLWERSPVQVRTMIEICQNDHQDSWGISAAPARETSFFIQTETLMVLNILKGTDNIDSWVLMIILEATAYSHRQYNNMPHMYWKSSSWVLNILMFNGDMPHRHWWSSSRVLNVFTCT